MHSYYICLLRELLLPVITLFYSTAQMGPMPLPTRPVGLWANMMTSQVSPRSLIRIAKIRANKCGHRKRIV